MINGIVCSKHLQGYAWVTFTEKLDNKVSSLKTINKPKNVHSFINEMVLFFVIPLDTCSTWYFV